MKSKKNALILELLKIRKQVKGNYNRLSTGDAYLVKIDELTEKFEHDNKLVAKNTLGGYYSLSPYDELGQCDIDNWDDMLYCFSDNLAEYPEDEHSQYMVGQLEYLNASGYYISTDVYSELGVAPIDDLTLIIDNILNTLKSLVLVNN